MSTKSKIRLDQRFLERLLEKLKTGNRLSIHLNATSGRQLARLDLADLADIDLDLPAEFLVKLLTEKTFGLPISFRDASLGENPRLVKLQKRLNHLVNQDREDFLEFGQQNLGFGYPLLVKHDRRDVTRIIKAPLLIWDLAISRSEHDKNSWTIERHERGRIKINELLISHIAKDEGIEFPGLVEDDLEDGLIDKTELLGFCQQVLTSLGSDQPISEQMRIVKCLDSKGFEKIHNGGGDKRNAWLHFSGTFGLYRSPKAAIIKATEELARNLERVEATSLESSASRISTVSSVDTNPSQEEIINTLDNDEIKLIQGPPGTGKSQSITAIISNALANGSRCLLVCEKHVALEVVHENLKRAGLAELTIIVDDVNKDRARVVRQARGAFENHGPVPDWNYDEEDFESHCREFARTKQEYNDKHKETLKPILGRHSRKGLIGFYLRYRKSRAVTQLAQDFSDLELRFDESEYAEIIKHLGEARVLHGQLEPRTLEVFDSISDHFFSGRMTTTQHQSLREVIERHLAVTREAMTYLDARSRQPDFAFLRDVLLRFRPNQLKNLRQQLTDLGLVADDIVKEVTKFRERDPEISYEDLVGYKPLPLVGNWSNKNKRIKGLRYSLTDDVSRFGKIRTVVERSGFQVLDLPQYRDLESFDQLLASISAVRSDIQARLNGLIRAQDAGQRLEDLARKLEEIDSQYSFQVDWSQYLPSTVISFETLRGNYANLTVHFTDCRNRMGDLDDYCRWRLLTKTGEPKVVWILSKLVASGIPASQWDDCFNAWYYHKILLRREDESNTGFHTSDGLLAKLVRLNDNLVDLQQSRIQQIWRDKRGYEFGRIGTNFNFLYNLRGSKRSGGRRNSLRKIINQDPDLFLSIFPIVLTNPSIACTLFAKSDPLFDYVIFDEASQLRIEDTLANLLMGKCKIIVGDRHQMPPSNYFLGEGLKIDASQNNDEDDQLDYESDIADQLADTKSLLEYTEELLHGEGGKGHRSYLDYHYRSQHPDLIAFSNAAIYGGNLVPMPPKTNYQAIDFRNVGGIYRDASHGNSRNTNETEAEEVLRILRDEIVPDEDNKYPSVGVVTFNIYQRDLIYDYINQASVASDEFADRYRDLKEGGLFVRSLESVQGDERDLIILSTTFGQREDGKFREHLGPLNMPGGYKLLNVLVTRARTKVYVCTSIPPDYYRKPPELAQNRKGKDVLYAYLYYCELVSEGCRDEARKLLDYLANEPEEKSRAIERESALTESPFEEEVYQELVQFIPESEIQPQFEIGGFRLDFLIGDKIALECDGKSYHKGEEAYKHDMYRQKELEKQGYIFHRIWSTNWFRDKDLEMKKFLDFYGAQSQAIREQTA